MLACECAREDESSYLNLSFERKFDERNNDFLGQTFFKGLIEKVYQKNSLIFFLYLYFI